MRSRTMRRVRERAIAAGMAWALLSGAAAAGDSGTLLTAAKRNDTAAVRALLKKSKVNERQPDGTTALAWAVYNDNTEAAALLLANGADPNLANDYGVGPLLL